MYIVSLYNISLYGKPIKGTGECKFSAFYNALQNLKNDNDRFLQIYKDRFLKIYKDQFFLYLCKDDFYKNAYVSYISWPSGAAIQIEKIV